MVLHVTTFVEVTIVCAQSAGLGQIVQKVSHGISYLVLIVRLSQYKNEAGTNDTTRLPLAATSLV